MLHVARASAGLLLQEHEARVRRGRPQTHSPNSLVFLPSHSVYVDQKPGLCQVGLWWGCCQLLTEMLEEIESHLGAIDP